MSNSHNKDRMVCVFSTWTCVATGTNSCMHFCEELALFWGWMQGPLSYVYVYIHTRISSVLKRSADSNTG